MKKFKIVFLIILMLIPSLFNFYQVEAKTIADLRQELQNIEKKEQENNQKIVQTESEINKTKQDISVIYTSINNISDEMIKTEQEITDLSEKIELRDTDTKSLMASLQKTTGNSFYIEYLFGSETISDFVYRYAITEQITEYNSNLIIEMNEMIKANEEKKVELEKKKIELNEKQSILANQLTELSYTKTRLYEFDRSIEDEIANSKSVIQMYKNAGCSESEDLNTCANRLLPPDTKFWRPFNTGYVTSNFGYRDAIYSGGNLISYSGFHEGIDLSNGLGLNNKIYSIANGKVVKIFYDQWGGNQIVIHHNINGSYYTSSYAHLSRILVNEGDIVTKDTVIAMMGSTGSSTGPHLHLAISTGLRYKDYVYYSQYVARCVNPRNLINIPSYGSWSDRVTYYK